MLELQVVLEVARHTVQKRPRPFSRTPFPRLSVPLPVLDTLRQSWKKGGSTVAMLPEGNSQNHSWQKDFGNYIALVLFFTSFV